MKHEPPNDPKLEKKPSEGGLSPELRALLDKDFTLSTNVYRVYKTVHDQAERGERVTASSFTVPEKIHELQQRGVGQFRGVRGQVFDQIWKEAEAFSGRKAVMDEWSDLLPSSSPLIEKAQEKWMEARLKWAEAKQDYFIRKTQTAYNDQLREKLDEWLVAHPEVKRAQFETQPLDTAFIKQYVAHAPKKNTALDPNTKTESELIRDLLGKNPGIAIGDVHMKDDTYAFIARNMPTFALSGVKRLYVEMQSQGYEKMSAQELRELAKTRKHDHMTLSTPEEIAKMYNVKKADDVDKAEVEMFAAAKEWGIKVIPIDKRTEAQQLESLDHRVARTNFTWLDEVNAGQKAQGKDAGKYVVFAGQAHVMNTHPTKGLVDDALGIPVLAFTKGKIGEGAVFERGVSANGPDFYLRGGEDYYQTKLSTTAQDIRDVAKILNVVPMLDPLKPLTTFGLQAAAAGIQKYTYKQVSDGPETPPAAPNVPDKNGQKNR